MLLLKTQTFSPNAPVVAPGHKPAAGGEESSAAAPAGTAVSTEAASAARRITGLTNRRMTAPRCAESVLHGVGSKANVSTHCRVQPARGSDVSCLLTVVRSLPLS